MAYAGTYGQERGNIRPAFQVEKLEGTRTRTVYDFEETESKRGKTAVRMVKRTEEVPETGFMVYFPHKHSIRVPNIQELERLGFNNRAHLIDMDTGEPVQAIEPVDLKAEVAASSKKPVSQKKAEED